MRRRRAFTINTPRRDKWGSVDTNISRHHVGLLRRWSWKHSMRLALCTSGVWFSFMFDLLTRDSGRASGFATPQSRLHVPGNSGSCPPKIGRGTLKPACVEGLAVSGGRPGKLTSEMAGAAGNEARCFDVLINQRLRRDDRLHVQAGVVPRESLALSG